MCVLFFYVDAVSIQRNALAASIVVTTIMAAAWGKWLAFSSILTVDLSDAGAGAYVCWAVMLSVPAAAAISGAHPARRAFPGRIE
jgi:hypothetical protein